MLDHETEFPGRLHVIRGNIANPLNLDSLGVHLRAKRKFRQDLQLLSCVVTIDVKGGISFRESLRLRRTKRILELDPILRHARENVIAGSVQNPAEPLDIISDQAIPQSANNWNTAANAGFESQADFLQSSRLHQTETIQCKQ